MQGWVSGGVFSVEILETRPGIAVFRVTGKDVEQVFANESGGHRWQRVPPTERRGRRQTSTITVAVFEERVTTTFSIDPKDLEWDTMRSGGKGGQNVNKVETAVRVHHLPSGLMVRCEAERSQYRNKELALIILSAKLEALEREAKVGKEVADRRQQIGTGQRGDKRRTIREQDGKVTDHVTGQVWTYSNYVRGIW
jgi:peptide chain release factor 1